MELFDHSRVSPIAARAREQPTATVWSMETGSRREGLTSWYISTAGHMRNK